MSGLCEYRLANRAWQSLLLVICTGGWLPSCAPEAGAEAAAPNDTDRQPVVASENLVQNPTFALSPTGSVGDDAVTGWRFFGSDGGSVSRPIDRGWRADTTVRIEANGGTRALYQDIGPIPITDDAGERAAFLFECRVRGEPGAAANLSTHDTTGVESRRSVSMIPDGMWRTLSVRGSVPESGKIRAHIWVTAGTVDVMMPRLVLLPGGTLLDGPRSAADATGEGVELIRWDAWDGRLSVQSTETNISLTFGRENIREGGFLMNVMTADHENLADYMCLPDDVLVAYTEDGGTVFSTRSHALRWDADYGPRSHAAFNKTGFVEHRYTPANGWDNAPSVDKHPWAYYTLPPVDISVRHEMHHAKKWIPMIVTATNRHTEPLRVHYLIQDGAWMTDFDAGHQENVHQYWPDGEYTDERVVSFSPEQRERKDAWGTIYNDENGAMSATLYAPPGPGNLLWMATWDGGRGRTYVDSYAANPKGWQTPGGMLESLGFDADGERGPDAYDSHHLRIRGALLDLGLLQPGETATAVIVKIFDTGYQDRADMVRRIEEEIDSIPPYAVPWLHGAD